MRRKEYTVFPNKSSDKLKKYSHSPLHLSKVMDSWYYNMLYLLITSSKNLIAPSTFYGIKIILKQTNDNIYK